MEIDVSQGRILAILFRDIQEHILEQFESNDEDTEALNIPLVKISPTKIDILEHIL